MKIRVIAYSNVSVFAILVACGWYLQTLKVFRLANGDHGFYRRNRLSEDCASKDLAGAFDVVQPIIKSPLKESI